MDRVALGRMQNPVRGFLHGTAAVVSVGAMVALVSKSDQAGETAASTIYGLSLVVMYATSALYHSIPWQPGWKLRFQKLDHTFIYALVAATFTALAVGVGEGPWLIVGLVGIWTLVALGETDRVFEVLERDFANRSVCFYLFDLKNHWFLAPLRADPRLQALFKQAGLPAPTS